MHWGQPPNTHIVVLQNVVAAAAISEYSERVKGTTGDVSVDGL